MINVLPDTPNEEWKKSNLKDWIYVSVLIGKEKKRGRWNKKIKCNVKNGENL